MPLLLDSLLRALSYSLLPRVLLLGLLPLLSLTLMVAAAAYWGWDAALSAVQGQLAGASILQPVWSSLRTIGGEGVRLVLAPLLVVLAALPLIILCNLLLVLWLITPTLTAFVARRRFTSLELRHGGSLLGSLLWTLGSSLAAFVALLVTLPLWLVPPLALVLPPIIWGWLTTRVMAYDVLARHASADERRILLHRHRWSLLLMGVLVGYVGGAPGGLWVAAVALGFGPWVMASLMAVLPLTVWVYTQIFALAALWFAHYLLAALARLRGEDKARPVDAPPAAGTMALR